MQGDDGLAGAGAAGDAGRSLVSGVDDGALGRVQVHPPGGERVGEDVHEFVGAADEDDAVAAAQDGRIDVLGVDGFVQDLRAEVRPHLVGGETGC